MRNLVLMRLMALSVLFLLVFMTASLFVKTTSASLPGPGLGYDLMEFDGSYAWEESLTSQSSSTDYITYTDLRDTYCDDSTPISTCETAVSGKKIRIDTAEELFRFSVDVSFEYVYPALTKTTKDADMVEFLLSLDYVLGKNIDYSVLGAKAFIPIGYSFLDSQDILYENNFTGTFDGQGFVISNLYVAGYEYLVREELVDQAIVDVALSPYYTMFTINEGEIRNLGLVNPTLELLNLHITITHVSNLVGINDGIVDHVFVLDERTDVMEAGIRYKVGTSSEDFEAAGIIHTNNGVFSNSYYVSPVVMNGAYINKFDSQPVLFLNNGSIANLVYDASVYLLEVPVGTQTFTVSVPNAYAGGETTGVLKSEASDLNQTGNIWYFYPDDSYPLVQGLVYDDVNDYYLISDAIDLVFFSRLIGFSSEKNGLAYAESDYVLTNSIDMGTISQDAYITPDVTFYGSFSGHNPSGSTLADNYYIYNLQISTGTLRASTCYSGLFSILGNGSEVNNLNINDSAIILSDTESYYSSEFYIGFIAGRMTGGTIEDVIIDVDIDLGTDAIGKTHVGSIVGSASGSIQRVASSGTVDAGDHVIGSEYSIMPIYYIGGIVGSATGLKLEMTDVVNHGTIQGLGTMSQFNLATGATMIDIKIGGIVGYLLNGSGAIHELLNITNTGAIHLDDVIYSEADPVLPSAQHVGGIFGELSGYAPILETAGAYCFANFYNSGTIYATYTDNTSIILAAGIGTSNTSEAVEYALMFNHGGFSYDTTYASYANRLFVFTGIIHDLGSSPVTLSRVYNYADLTFDSAYYTEVSPLYNSEYDNETEIQYSANFGNVTFWNNSGDSTITLGADLHVAGISTSDNISLLNVVNEGMIRIVNIDSGSHSLNVAGMLNTLSGGYIIENSLNKGGIVVADIIGSGNIYISGIVNNNYSGDLHELWQSESQPIAGLGIINTINYGNITTSHTESHYGINGTNNTFAGGVATFNSGSIQDSANLGNISLFNSSTSGEATFNPSVYLAGLISSYTAGVVAGGVVAAVISGDSRIYDAGNIGNVMTMSYRFARAGGVLGVALYAEADAGGITEDMDLEDTIENSVLANGVNFGDIAALTNQIGSYTEDPHNESFAMRYGSGSSYTSGATISISTIEASNERPRINASAGGVIGYGLSVMRNMLNHGAISSTDVAGGIVGATYVLGSQYTPYPITYVDISTAINYGDIKAVPAANVMGSGTNVDDFLLDFTDLADFYMADGNSFIFPTTYCDRFSPGMKRGFGGIFGRLQRGTNGVMTSEDEGNQFNFIVNANPNIDLIGRLDQVYNATSSARYFRFNDAIYYSAKLDDTTQIVFTGFHLAVYVITSVTGSRRNWSVTATIYEYQQVGIVMERVDPEVVLGTYNYRSTNYYAPTVGTLLTNPSAYYYDEIDVPWITEEPTDPNLTNPDTEYMYDDDFPMRTSTDLSKYIYYMETDLLAPRFQAGGSNSRLNGMYVLSTTAGSTFGEVLPSNIDTGEMRPINEDYPGIISLDIDYDSVLPEYTSELAQSVLDRYESLKQTIFNDRSELIPETTPSIALAEDGGSDTVLENGTVDYVNKIVYFSISMEAFLSGQTLAAYDVTNALTSASALIAIRAEDYYGHAPSTAELEAFRALLLAAGESDISTSYPAKLEVTLPAKTITSDVTLSLGYFTVYSEAFVGSNLFASNHYYDDYEVRVTFTPGIAYAGGTTSLNKAAFNGGSLIDVSSTPTDIRNYGTVGSAGELMLEFTDTNAVFIENYDFQEYFVLKYNDGTTVPDTYYDVTASPTTILAGTGTYRITFIFDGSTRMGDYYLEYSYFPTSETQSVYFDKAASSAKAILDLSYYSIQDSLAINGLGITSDVNLGYDLDIDSGTANFTENTNQSIPGYLSNKTYDISYMTAGTFAVSPFAKVTGASLVSTTYAAGYKDYLIQYVIEAEDGSTNTYNHHIYERVIDFTFVLKDGNEIDPLDAFASREADMTTFTVDLGLDQELDLYNMTPGNDSYIVIDVTATSLDGLTPYLPEEIIGLTYGSDPYLYIYMDYDTSPGIYTFNFTYYRDGTANYVSLATSLEITKLEGVNAYLNDIRFSQLATETSYPDMHTTDQYGVVNSDYYPLVYFAGIDYDGADLAGYQYFKVDGKVSNIPLEFYAPYMLDYLPYGATVARYAYEQGTGWYWTAEVGANATVQEEALLRTNFTVFPDTGLEPGETEEVMILYRVTSEDGNHSVYYYVTVTDVEFNATFIFDIYYCTGESEATCTPASESVEFNEEMVIITVKNLLTDGDDTIVNVTDPEDYPVFTQLVSDPETAPNGLISNMTQFIYTYAGEYYYSFGRNRSGFFAFNVTLPVDKYQNELYTYEIEFSDYILNDISDYVSGLEGKYYFIGFSTKNRTRRFNVYIREKDPVSTDQPWGLFDFFTSWGE